MSSTTWCRGLGILAEQTSKTVLFCHSVFMAFFSWCESVVLPIFQHILTKRYTSVGVSCSGSDILNSSSLPRPKKMSCTEKWAPKFLLLGTPLIASTNIWNKYRDNSQPGLPLQSCTIIICKIRHTKLH